MFMFHHINKTADEVLRLIKTYCYTYGLPRNGKDLKNKKKHSATKMARHILQHRKGLWRKQRNHWKKK